jgi:glutamate synthase domain-containing protein 2
LSPVLLAACWLLFSLVGFGVDFLMLMVFAGLVVVGLHDLRQTRSAVLRNYPVIGHMRFWLEFIRPEIRQYFIESDSEPVPFSRAQLSLVYRRAKGAQDNQPFGKHLEVSRQGYEWINHSMQPSKVPSHDFRVSIGGTPEKASSSRLPCTQPYACSVFNISAMSFWPLSADAILALNAGAKRGGFAHDTGEGSISTHHRTHGGDLIWEIGSGYFGSCNDEGNFCPERFAANARDPQVKRI